MAEGKVVGVNNVAIKVATKPKFKASCLAILMFTPPEQLLFQDYR